MSGTDGAKAAPAFYVPGLIEQVERLRLEDTNLVIRSDLLLGLVAALKEQATLLDEAWDVAHKLHGGLRNVLLLALRDKGAWKDENAEHLVRFCREAGVEPQIIRDGEIISNPRDEHWPFVAVSAAPHRGCGGVVRYYEINSDHGDNRLRCDKCGKVWVEEGNDG